jgi:hypothetical protein
MEKAKGSEADIDNAALLMIQNCLGGGWFEPGPVQWEVRKDILVRTFQRANFFIVEDNNYTQDMIRALDGRWYYAKSPQGDLRSERPKKPNVFSDLGDSLTYLLSRYGMGAQAENIGRPLKVLTNLDIDQPPSNRVLMNQNY